MIVTIYIAKSPLEVFRHTRLEIIDQRTSDALHCIGLPYYHFKEHHLSADTFQIVAR